MIRSNVWTLDTRVVRYMGWTVSKFRHGDQTSFFKIIENTQSIWISNFLNYLYNLNLRSIIGTGITWIRAPYGIAWIPVKTCRAVESHSSVIEVPRPCEQLDGRYEGCFFCQWLPTRFPVCQHCGGIFYWCNRHISNMLFPCRRIIFALSHT